MSVQCSSRTCVTHGRADISMISGLDRRSVVSDETVAYSAVESVQMLVAPQPQPPCGDQHAQYGEVTDGSRTETSLRTAAARVSERPCPRSPCAAEARRSTLEALRTKVPRSIAKGSS